MEPFLWDTIKRTPPLRGHISWFRPAKRSYNLCKYHLYQRGTTLKLKRHFFWSRWCSLNVGFTIYFNCFASYMKCAVHSHKGGAIGGGGGGGSWQFVFWNYTLFCSIITFFIRTSTAKTLRNCQKKTRLALRVC